MNVESKPTPSAKPWIALGAVCSGLSVMLGALGAHALNDRLMEKKLAPANKSVRRNQHIYCSRQSMPEY